MIFLQHASNNADPGPQWTHLQKNQQKNTGHQAYGKKDKPYLKEHNDYQELIPQNPVETWHLIVLVVPTRNYPINLHIPEI